MSRLIKLEHVVSESSRTSCSLASKPSRLPYRGSQVGNTCPFPALKAGLSPTCSPSMGAQPLPPTSLENKSFCLFTEKSRLRWHDIIGPLFGTINPCLIVHFENKFCSKLISLNYKELSSFILNNSDKVPLRRRKFVLPSLAEINGLTHAYSTGFGVV